MAWVVGGTARGAPTPLAPPSCCLFFVVAVVSASFNYVVRPEFGEETSELNVTTFVGQTARLPCTVRHLAGKRVSWIRGLDLQVLSTGRVTFSTDLRISVLPGTSTFKSRKSRSVHCLGCGTLKSRESSSVGSVGCGNNTSSSSTHRGAAGNRAGERYDCGGGKKEPDGYYRGSGGGRNCGGDCGGGGSTVIRDRAGDENTVNAGNFIGSTGESYLQSGGNSTVTGGGVGGDTFIDGDYVESGDGDNSDCVGDCGDGDYHDTGGGYREQTQKNINQQITGDFNPVDYLDVNGDHLSQTPEIRRQEPTNTRTYVQQATYETNEELVEDSDERLVMHSGGTWMMQNGEQMVKQSRIELVKRSGDDDDDDDDGDFYHTHPHTAHSIESESRTAVSDPKRKLEINSYQERNLTEGSHHQQRSLKHQRKNYRNYGDQRNHDYKRNSERKIDYERSSNRNVNHERNSDHKGNFKRKPNYQRNRDSQGNSKRNPNYQRNPDYHRNSETNSSYQRKPEYQSNSHRHPDHLRAPRYVIDRPKQASLKSSRRRSRREHRYDIYSAKPPDAHNTAAFLLGYHSSRPDRVASSRHSQAYAENSSPIAIYPQGRSAQATGAASKGLQPGPNYIEGVWEPEDYTLQIKYTKPEDAGTYICQINTEPRITQIVHLNVVKMRAEIVGSRELFVKAGNPVTLACRVNHGTLMPGFILWYKNDLLVEYGDRVEVQTGSDGVSHLLLKHARPSDSANYTCSPSNGAPASLTLNVIVDERQAAMQQGNAAPLPPLPLGG